MPKDVTKDSAVEEPKSASSRNDRAGRNKPSGRKAPKNTKEKKGKRGGTKRALSAYMFFSQDWRERIKTENPDAGFGEIGKLLGAKWKEMSDEEKKPYAEQAVSDKARAEKEKQQEQVEEKKAKDVTPAPDADEEDDE